MSLVTVSFQADSSSRKLASLSRSCNYTWCSPRRVSPRNRSEFEITSCPASKDNRPTQRAFVSRTAFGYLCGTCWTNSGVRLFPANKQETGYFPKWTLNRNEKMPIGVKLKQKMIMGGWLVLPFFMDFVDPAAEIMRVIIAKKHHEVRWFAGLQ